MSTESHSRRLLMLEKGVRDLSTQPRLANSSIDGGALEIRDPTTGRTSGIIGQQFDGTVTVGIVGGTFPASPTMPFVTEIVGGLRIYWDGTYADGSVTRMDFRRVTFHAVEDVDDLDILNPTQIVGEITIATGGEVTVALPYVEQFICAVVWTEAGQFSVESDFAFGTPLFVKIDDLDPGIIIGPDGLPPEKPGGWTATLKPLGILALMATWEQVPNADPVEYDVYVADQSFSDLADAELAGTNAGTFFSIQDYAGAPLVAGTTYFCRVVARDADGSSEPSDLGSTLPRLAGDGSIDQGWTYLGGVEAAQVLTGNLTASLAVLSEIKTAAVGRNISLSTARGLEAVDSTGAIIASIPTSLSQNISLQADVVLKSATATGAVAFRHPGNELAQASALTLRTGTAAPVSPPTASITWNTIARPSISGPGNYRSGNYHSGSNRLYTCWAIWGYSAIEWYNATTGAVVGSITVGYPPTSGAAANVYSVARYGNDIYCHLQRAGDPVWYLRRYNATTLAQVGSDIALGSDSIFDEGTPAITINTAGELVLVFFDGGVLYRQTFNRDTGAAGSSTNLGFTTITSASGNVISLYEGPAEVGGADRLWFTLEGHNTVHNIQSYVGGTPEDATREFYTAFDNDACSLSYDTTRGAFVSMSRVNGSLHIYDGTNWTTESSDWIVTNTWADTDTTGGTHQTTQGPSTIITMKKRARLMVSSAPIPSDVDLSNHDDPNAVRFYVGRASGAPSTQWLQASPATGIVTATIATAIFNNTDTLHPNPPTTGDFPNTTPAIIRSDASNGDGPLMWFDGSGAGRWKKYDDILAKIEFAPTAGPNVDITQYNGTMATKKAGFIHVGIELGITGAITAGATVFSLSAGYLPSRVVRVPVFNYTTGTMMVLTIQANGVTYCEQNLSNGHILLGHATFPTP